MVCNIVKDAMFLAMKSEPATDCPEDRKVAKDLCDTLKAHAGSCVGMAANMIGVRKTIIAVTMGFFHVPMINPVIVARERSVSPDSFPGRLEAETYPFEPYRFPAQRVSSLA